MIADLNICINLYIFPTGQVVGYIDDTVADNDSGAESIDDVESDFDLSENERLVIFQPFSNSKFFKKYNKCPKISLLYSFSTPLPYLQPSPLKPQLYHIPLSYTHTPL